MNAFTFPFDPIEQAVADIAEGANERAYRIRTAVVALNALRRSSQTWCDRCDIECHPDYFERHIKHIHGGVR
jgi:hypothetical protein